MPKVSVIIPVYKAELYIEKCARTLFEQTLDAIEYIFVNDCTPDSSFQILNRVLKEYPSRQPQVKMLNHSINTGQSGARRDGMKLATGDYIIHCDADDWVELDMYEKMYYKALETGADAVCCDMVMEFSQSQTYLKYNSDFSDHQLMRDCIAPISVEYCSMCNRLISRNIFDQYAIEPFEGVNMWDDVGLSIRLRYYIKKNVVINEPLYHYNGQNENSTTRRPVLGRVQEQIECARRLATFFRQEDVSTEYNLFVSLIKLIAKDNLFYIDMELWRRTFPETNKYIHVLKCHFSKHARIKRQIVAYGGFCGVLLLRVRTMLKHKI